MFKLFLFFILIFVLAPLSSFASSKKHWLHVDGEKNFSNIIVISKKFLRKTNKLEVFTYGAASINNAFYLDIAPGIDLTYYFKEKYAISFSYLHFFNSKKKITKQLDETEINGKIGSVPRQFIGAYFHWSPIYGKFALLNKKLIPFDLYFALGLGQFSAEYRESKDNGSDKISPFKAIAFSGQMGQQFAWSSNTAIHWKILWNFFQLPKNSTVSGYTNNILFGMGVSWFLGGEKTSR
ncbi:MAG: outer membrane beta-barrel domain-containing protein [Bdellovibrionales bacterium]|nr:outer membrane beta-barrel domain-containing protein [Bdellovibrionales bacterium]